MTLEIRTNWPEEIFTSEDLTDPHMSSEEVATLSELGISFDKHLLTETPEDITDRFREGPFLPVYPLADWLAWNWWRLLWEPFRRFPVKELPKRVDWEAAHYVSSLRGGWLWPDILIRSDGYRVALDVHSSKATHESDRTFIVSTGTFEGCVDDFVGRVLDRLGKHSLEGTDLHSTWRDLSEEREDPDLSLYRRFEAYLGCDPGEAQPEQIHELIREGEEFGLNAVSEVAVEDPSFLSRLYDTAQTSGFDYCPADGFQWQRDEAINEVGTPTSTWSQIPAWKVGAMAAGDLRQERKLGSSTISNPDLSSLCGIDPKAISRTSSGSMSFLLDSPKGGTGCLVLRSRHSHGRRFEVARLLGDRLLTDVEESLSPATRSYTYRQRMQRAFAAEFLCPIDSLVDFLKDDYSEENRQEASYHYRVSEYAVRAQLVNGGYLSRDELQTDLCDIEAEVEEAA